MVSSQKIFIRSAGLLRNSSGLHAITSIIILTLRSLLPIAALFLIKYFVDSVTNTGSSFLGGISSGISWLIIAIVFILLFDDILSVWSSFNSKKQSFLLEKHISSLIHRKASRLGLTFFENPSFLDILSRATRDISWRPAAIISGAILFLRGAISFTAMAVVLARLGLLITIVLILAVLPLLLIKVRSSRKLYGIKRSVTQSSRQSSYFSWLMTGERPAREAKLFNLYRYFEKLHTKYFTASKQQELATVKRNAFLESLAAVAKMLVFSAILVYLFRSFTEKRISAGETAMYLVAFRQAMIYLRDMVNGLTGMIEDRLFLKDLFIFLDLGEENVNPGREISVPAFDEIEVRNLTFRYESSMPPVLENICMKIKKGEKVAVVGPNGSGKTTLVKLLSGLYEPDSGVVLLNGNDIGRLDADEYRRCFSMVFQDFMLYYLTAGENISLGDTSAVMDKERLHESAAKAGISCFLEGLPDGYDTMLGHHSEGGRELSWGEWQKIAIARALYRRAPVLILDEPSSSLDADSEYEIFSRLNEIIGDRTCILISHRLANVSHADRIIVLDKGTVAESGTHEELMAAKGRYFSMFTHQKGMYR